MRHLFLFFYKLFLFKKFSEKEEFSTKSTKTSTFHRNPHKYCIFYFLKNSNQYYEIVANHYISTALTPQKKKLQTSLRCLRRFKIKFLYPVACKSFQLIS